MLNSWLENGHYLVHSSTIFKQCSEFFGFPYLHLFNNSQWFGFQQDGKWFSQHRLWRPNVYNLRNLNTVFWPIKLMIFSCSSHFCQQFWTSVWRRLRQGNYRIIVTWLFLIDSVLKMFSVDSKALSHRQKQSCI